ncbi:MAG: hypothetical protein ACM3ON_07795 [Chloroflexota bacterium]
MNRYQKLIVAVGAITVLLTVLMPPQYVDVGTMNSHVNWARLVMRLITIIVAVLLAVLVLGKVVK